MSSQLLSLLNLQHADLQEVVWKVQEVEEVMECILVRYTHRETRPLLDIHVLSPRHACRARERKVNRRMSGRKADGCREEKEVTHHDLNDE